MPHSHSGHTHDKNKSETDTKPQGDRVKEIFDNIDKDGSGTISINELSSFMKTRGISNSVHQAQNLINRNDSDTMTFEDFVSFVTNQETQLRLAFNKLDRNNDNEITSEEIRLAMLDLGVEVTEQEADRLLHKMDRDGSHTIDFEEWRDFLLFSQSTKLTDILKYWRKSNRIDIGENSSCPDEFTDEERANGYVWKTILCGGFASAVARTCTAPLDRLKVMWQVEVESGQVPRRNIFRSLQAMMADGGLPAMWRGNGVNCAKIAPISACKCYMYEMYKTMVLNQKPSSTGPAELSETERFLCGGMAGVSAQTLFYPMEVLKTRMTLRTYGQYKSTVDCARHIFSNEGGIRSFYRGNILNVVGILPYAGIDLVLYERFRQYYMDRHPDEDAQTPPLYISLSAGAVSSLVAQIATFPCAVMRTKLQARVKVGYHNSSIKNLFLSIWRRDGIKGFYHGLGPNMLKAIPSVSISYAVFEEMQNLFGMDS